MIPFAMRGGDAAGAVPAAAPGPARPPFGLPGTWTVERRPLAACADIVPQWRDLARRAIEPNPFCEPDLLLAAAQHLVEFREAAATLVWRHEIRAEGTRLVAFVPRRRQTGLFSASGTMPLDDAYLPVAAPLVDVEGLPAIVDRLLADSPLGEIELTGLVAGGPLDEALQDAALTRGWRTHFSPALRRGTGASKPACGKPVTVLPPGTTLQEARGRADIRDAVEFVLALEASGARARAGQAILQNPREASFLRALTRTLSGSRQIRVALLLRGDAPVAGAIQLCKGRRGWLIASAAEDGGDHPAALDSLIATLRRTSPKHAICVPAHADLEAAGLDRIATGTRFVALGRRARPPGLAERVGAALREGRFRLVRAAGGA